MTVKTQSTIASAVKRLKNVFDLSERDIAPLNQLMKLDLTSLAYTIDGGFDLKTGNYHSEPRPINYKIRAKYFDREEGNHEKMLILMPIRETEDPAHYKKVSSRKLKKLEKIN